MMTILVTGAAGFVGHALSLALHEDGHRVIGLISKPNRDDGSLAKAGVEVQIGDLSKDTPRLDGVDCIIHAAGRTLRDGTPELFLRDNAVSTGLFVRAVEQSKVKRFIHLSTVSVYGKVTVRELDEASPMHESSHYGLTKLLAEEFVKGLAASDISILNVRLATILGRGAQGHLLSRTLEKARKGELITVLNPAEPFNNAVHLRNLAECVCLLVKMEKFPHPLVNLAASSSIPFGDLVKQIVQTTGSKSKVVYAENAPHSFTISPRRALDDFHLPMWDTGKTISTWLDEEK